LASDICPALHRNSFPQFAATLGIHVDSLVLHLHQPEVADVVEGAISNSSSSVALGSLPSGLAGNGCGCFPGHQAACTPASVAGLVVGRVRNAHFVILLASFQVPYRLQWKQDLQKLMAFNRKLLWVQSGFTVLTIIAFGTLTLALHTELLRGDRAALGLACFIGIYWTTRILVDAIYFSHDDWPKGAAFVVGHALLTLLFSFLAASYLGLCVWQVWFRPNG
jgi:hypothetical protein